MTSNAPKIFTRCAHWGYDDHRYFGHAVFAELAGHETITGLMALSVLGRRLLPEQCSVLDDVACAITLADPRIWPLKVTRLVASYGSASSALIAGMLTLEEARIGPWAIARAAANLLELHAELNGHQSDGEFVEGIVRPFLERHPILWGFGTPFRAQDERLVALRLCMHRRQRDELPYWRTMLAVVDAVEKCRGLVPNAALAIAAILLDLGFSVEQTGVMSLSLLFHTFLGNATEGAAQRPAALRDLPLDCIDYVGRAPRCSPRFEKARGRSHGA